MVFFIVQNLILSVPIYILSGLMTETLLPRLIIYVLFFLIAIHTSVLLPGVMGYLTPVGLLSGSLFSGALLWVTAVYVKRVNLVRLK